MCEAAEAKGVKHMGLFTWRFLPEYRHLKHLVEAGHVGRVRQMTAHFIASHAVGPD